MPRARIRVRKDAAAPAVSKSLPSGVPEGGIHVHMLERELKRTKTDGAHFHVFRRPDGTFFRTMEDGRHGHPIESDMGNDWIHDGAHAHRIPMEGGDVLVTEIDGWHNHQAQTDSTAFDGLHTHKLLLPDGTTIESLLPAQHHILEGSPSQADAPEAPPASELAKVAKWRGPIPADAYMTKTGDLEIHFKDQVIVLALARGTEEITSADVEGFTIHGSSRFKAPEHVSASIRSNPEKKASDGWPVSQGTIEVGLIHNDQREFFLQLPAIAGTLKMTRRDGMWTANLVTDEPPDVLKVGAPMPPEGCSALPQSLENDVPESVRYWEATSKDATQLRDWLVEIDYFTHDAEIRLVGGVLRKVLVERRYFSHEPEDVSKSTWPNDVVRLLPVGEIVSPFAGEDWRTTIERSNALLILDPPSDAGLTPQTLVDLVKGRKFLLTMADTPEARIAFEKAGRPFKLHDPAVLDRLFVASFPIPLGSVAWLSSTTKAEQEAADRVYARLSKTRIVRSEGGEERFVYGIAMEPDEVDSQGDTQTAETIRTAAHGFMEDYGNIGLQHQKFVNGKVKILESAIMPGDVQLGTETIKSGTWVFGVRVLDDEIWKSVLDGSITGFSIGGTAIRDPL